MHDLERHVRTATLDGLSNTVQGLPWRCRVTGAIPQPCNLDGKE